jgi:hypothetical protein
MYAEMEAWPQRADKLSSLNGHCPISYSIVHFYSCMRYIFSTWGGQITKLPESAILTTNRVGIPPLYASHLAMPSFLWITDGDYWVPIQYPADLPNACRIHVQRSAPR